MEKNKAGILIVDKPQGKTSFSLVKALRKKLDVKKIGHAGTLDPMATGVMILLIGKKYTRLSDTFLNKDKEYTCEITLGKATDTFDREGKVIFCNDSIPQKSALEEAILTFQGEIEQTPPMFSAKKVKGQKLYSLARQGKTIERKPSSICIETTLLHYEYPFITLHITCSKGTYIRSIANDLGEKLKCGAHLSNLKRTRSGPFTLDDSFDGNLLFKDTTDANTILEHVKT